MAFFTKELKIAASVSNLADTMDFITEQAEAAGLSAPAVHQLELACEEIVVNVVHHAYKDVPGLMRISCSSRKAGEIDVEIVDWGPSFNILDAPEPDLQSDIALRPIGGLGVFLAKQVVDELTWEREDDANVVRIRKGENG